MKKLPTKKSHPSLAEKKSVARAKKHAKDLSKKTKLFGDTLKKKGLKVINKKSDGENIVIDLENLSGPAAGIFGDIVLEFLGLKIKTSSDGAEQPTYSSTVTLNASTFMSGNVNTRDLVKMGDYLVEALKQVKRYRMPGDKRAQGQFLINFKEEIVTNQLLLETKDQFKKIMAKKK